MDIDPLPMKNVWVVLEPQAELGSETKIYHGPKYSSGEDYYSLVHDRERSHIKPPERYR